MITLSKDKLLRFNQAKIKGQRVILRVDFNVDWQKGKIFDRYRIEAIKPTLKILQRAKQVILVSHWRNPKKREASFSFKRILPAIEKILEQKLGFLPDFRTKPKEKFNLLENIRFWPGEKKNDPKLVEKLKRLGDLFINDAFSVSHRKHASVVGLSKVLPTYFGLHFEKELNLMNRALRPKKPFMLILGGAKISTKLPLIFKFLPKADLIFLAGGLANTFLKAKGFEIGQSLVEEKEIPKIKDLFSVKIFLPLDFVLSNQQRKYLGEIKPKDKILDIGPETVRALKLVLKSAKTIIWNGPLGYIEKKPFRKATRTLAKFLAQHKGFVLIGGGDTIAFLESEKLLPKFKYTSTAGGAMLYYLAQETLPVFEK